MTRRRTRAYLWIAGLAAIGAGVFWLVSWKNRPPEVPCIRVVRETLVSTLATNGRVEPMEWASARAEREGLAERILVEKGRFVTAGAALVELDAREARADLAAAQARISQAQADIETLARGGKQVDLAEIASGLERARLERDLAKKEYDTLVRLEAKKAATTQEVLAAKERVDRAELQIRSLDARRTSLVATVDRTAAEARLKDAQAAAKLADERIARGTIRAPIDGVVYQFDLKPGAYLNRGDLVANIGKLDRVKVNVYVDEPELGRVAVGMPVQITWDARVGRVWKGTVDKLPTQIVALNTRQVGEVLCVIENPGRELLPGTNINAEIRSRVVEGALSVPKEVLRRESGELGVYAVDNGVVRWRKVSTGTASVTRTQVEGLKEGEAVALPSERALKDGMTVSPSFAK